MKIETDKLEIKKLQKLCSCSMNKFAGIQNIDELLLRKALGEEEDPFNEVEDNFNTGPDKITPEQSDQFIYALERVKDIISKLPYATSDDYYMLQKQGLDLLEKIVFYAFDSHIA